VEHIAYEHADSMTCCLGRGDVLRDDRLLTNADLTYFVEYMFLSGPPPPCKTEADVNGNGWGPDIQDLVYAVNYLYKKGPDPVPCP